MLHNPSQANAKKTAAEDQNLNRSMGDAACFGGMVGCGETYFPAFALAVGLGETAAGLVASLPMLAGGMLQLISPWAIAWIGGLRRWIVTGACLQALAFLPLAVAAWMGNVSLPLLIVIASVYWGAGLSTGPAWNTWIEKIVPKERRVHFFSRRSRLQQVCTFAALMVAGFSLQFAASQGLALLGFATLFLVACGLRLVSAVFLHRTSDSSPTNAERIETGTSDAELVKSTPGSALGNAAGTVASTSQTEPVSQTAKRLLIYLVAMQAFVQFSGPFFAPYMLKQLNFGYGEYVTLMSLAFVSKVLSMAFWGRIAERHGAKTVLWLGGIGLVPLALLWTFSDNFLWLAFTQIVSGVAWGAYELGFFLMFFETLPANQRTRLLTYYNFANALAMAVGALSGAALLAWVGCCSEAYFTLFTVSSAGRLLCLGLLLGIVVPKNPLRSIRLRALSVRLGAGSVDAPIVASAESAS